MGFIISDISYPVISDGLDNSLDCEHIGKKFPKIVRKDFFIHQN